MTRFLLAGAAAAALVACDRSTHDAGATRTLADSSIAAAGAALPPGHVPIGAGSASLPAAAQALLDSGNVAFRAKDYAGAQAFYRRAAVLAPRHAAPWFGTYMVGQATNDTALADSALRMVQERAPTMSAHPAAPPGAAGAPPGTGPAEPSGAPLGGLPPLPHASPPPTKRRSTAPAS